MGGLSPLYRMPRTWLRPECQSGSRFISTIRQTRPNDEPRWCPWITIGQSSVAGLESAVTDDQRGWPVCCLCIGCHESVGNVWSSRSISQRYVQAFRMARPRLVSMDRSGNPGPPELRVQSPTISADGRFVAFVSIATNLSAPGVSRSADLSAGHAASECANHVGVAWITIVAISQRPPDQRVQSPTISADGRFVAFVSRRDEL